MSIDNLKAHIRRQEIMIRSLRKEILGLNIEIGRLITVLKEKPKEKRKVETKSKSELKTKSETNLCENETDMYKEYENEFNDATKYKGESGIDTGFCGGCHKPIPFNVPFCLDENGKTVMECFYKYQKEMKK